MGRHHLGSTGLSIVLVALGACSPGGGSEASEPPSVAPAEIHVQASRGRVSLSWAPVVGASSYLVYWDESRAVDPETAPSIETVETRLEHVDLTDDKGYFYLVVAVNEFGQSPPSAEVSAVPTAAYEPAWAGAVPSSTISLDFDGKRSPTDNGRALQETLADLRPGERLELGTGVFVVDSYFSIDLDGTAVAPIWIVAKPGAVPVITRSNDSQNTVNFGARRGASYLCVRGLEFTGGDTALKLYSCSNLWIDRCHIHHCGGAGITANTRNTDNLYITRNEIHHTLGTAEGMYLGANDGKVVTHHSVIAQNHVHHCRGTQGDGIEIKQGSFANWVVENHVHDCKYPCITVYGTGGNIPNLIERNTCYRSDTNVMQVQGEAVVRNNLLMSGSIGFQSHDHQGTSRNLYFVHNTIINEGRGANLNSWNGRPGMVFVNNIVYSKNAESIRFAGGSAGVFVAGNVVVGPVVGTNAPSLEGEGMADFIDAAWDGSRRDAIPVPGSVIQGAGDPSWSTDRDVRGFVRRAGLEAGCFDGKPRIGG